MKKSGFCGIQTVLVLGPHADDGEFSCGATISRMIEEGLDVHYAVFSTCEKSIPAGFPPGTIKKELLQAVNFLGIKPEFFHLFDYEVRVFPAFRQEILEDMVLLSRTINPDLVLLPGSSDIHQDHKTIFEEGIRAFKYSKLLGYEMPWNNFDFSSRMYVGIEESHLEKKIRTLSFYKSQMHRPYSSEEYIRSLAKMKGLQVKMTYAETFEIIRWTI